MLGDEQRQTLVFFLDTLSTVMSESHQSGALPDIQERLNMALALLERDFPISVMVQMNS